MASKAPSCLRRALPNALSHGSRPLRTAGALHRRTPHSSPRQISSTPPFRHNAPKSSVDANEVSHFNALASSWWDPHGPSRLLHLMNPLRHTFISKCRNATIPQPGEKLHYLDVGCGGGIFAESAARLPSTASVTAIDPTPEVLKIAEAHKKRDPTLTLPGKLTYHNIPIEQLSTLTPSTPATPSSSSSEGGPQQYDIVTLFEVLEHVNTPSSFLTSCMSHVKPGGWLILSTISRTWTSWVVTNVVAEDILGIVPKGTHEWAKYVNESELRGWFRKQSGWGAAWQREGYGGMQMGMQTMGVVYVPGLGWKEVPGGEGWGNYFFGVRKDS